MSASLVRAVQRSRHGADIFILGIEMTFASCADFFLKEILMMSENRACPMSLTLAFMAV